MAVIIDNNYSRVHQWLSRNFGKALLCENESCERKISKSYHYALIHGKEYEKVRSNFKMMCNSCHRKYDYTDEQRIQNGINKKGKPSPNQKPVIMNDSVYYKNMSEAAKSNGILVTSIANNLSGLSKRTKIGTFKYATK